jgi:hypothetical protein
MAGGRPGAAACGKRESILLHPLPYFFDPVLDYLNPGSRSGPRIGRLKLISEDLSLKSGNGNAIEKLLTPVQDHIDLRSSVLLMALNRLVWHLDHEESLTIRVRVPRTPGDAV